MKRQKNQNLRRFSVNESQTFMIFRTIKQIFKVYIFGNESQTVKYVQVIIVFWSMKVKYDIVNRIIVERHEICFKYILVNESQTCKKEILTCLVNNELKST